MNGFRQLINFNLKKIFAQKAKGSVDYNFENVEQYAQKYQIRLEKFTENHLLDLKKPTCLSKKPIESIQPFNSYLQAIFWDIRESGFRFSNNHLIDNDLQVIYHWGLPFNILPISHQFLNAKPKKLKGTIAYLSNTVPNHYGHWLRLVLPLLRIYEKYIPLSEIDYFYVGEVEITPFMRETLELLGIPAEKIINFPCQADRLLAVFTQWQRQNGNYGYLDLGSYQFIRENFLSKVDVSSNCCYASRVYITRGKVNWRKVLNEEAIFEVLRKYDFELRVMDNLSILEQIQIFYHADVLIAPHGSALTNLFFAKPDARILEIFPHNYTCITSFTLAAYAQTDYYYLQGEPIADNQASPPYEDILLNINNLEKAILTLTKF